MEPHAPQPAATARAPLVLIPGLMCDATVWEPLLPALGQHSHCQVADHATADRIDTMARQVLEAAPPRFALAGHSMGGRVAVEAVRLAPERVERLALLDTGYRARPPGAAGDEEARKRHALLEIARRDGVPAMARQWVQGMLEHAGHMSTMEQPDAVAQALLEWLDQAPAQG